MAAARGVLDLEAGGIVVADGPSFEVSAAEWRHITEGVASGRSKNVSLDPGAGTLRGAAAHADGEAVVVALMRRHADWSRDLIERTAPPYGPHLRMGRASLRTRDAAAPALSPRKDDKRLHADAFPSRPTGGERILRVFSNVNPDGQPRVWNIGEPFEAYARRWADKVRRPWPGEASLLQRLGVTRGRRTSYDAMMLGLHDRAKLDTDYQANAPRREAAFPAGASWIVFTDGVVHAAMSGCLMLEQTFYLPVAAMADPETSPLRVLERMTGRRLV